MAHVQKQLTLYNGIKKFSGQGILLYYKLSITNIHCHGTRSRKE